ncbi:hypothetical protein CEXT_762741 [Caerostris extrusa]|uniref:Uncharacterized protein n=1 Tax=Caerostris extrusa TaxID=172846 RepID=A0AAV4TF26_CAEEX|nr:hypothetical protein CEXT_762741 [Caerostris extrusa]
MDLAKITAYLVTIPFVWFATNLFLFGDSSYAVSMAIYICVIELICQICKENAWMNDNNRHQPSPKRAKASRKKLNLYLKYLKNISATYANISNVHVRDILSKEKRKRTTRHQATKRQK